ncbi:MAG: sugar phosphate isomerase/epimerase family protein [Thermomicrobiales bacterium]
MEKTLGAAAIGIRGLSLPQTLDLALETGFDSIAFDVREAARLAATGLGEDGVDQLFKRNGVRPGLWAVPVAWRDDDQASEELQALPGLAALARNLGCNRATSGFRPGSDERAFDANLAWHVERLKPVAEALAQEDCMLALEFIGPATFRAPSRHEFIYTLEGTMEMIRQIGTGNVGLLLDAWHLYTSGGSMDDIARLKADDVVVVHVNDAPSGIPLDEQVDNVRALPLETGVIDLVRFMEQLKTIGFDGPVMPEPFSQRVEELAMKDPRAAARETSRSMDALWNAAGLG